MVLSFPTLPNLHFYTTQGNKNVNLDALLHQSATHFVSHTSMNTFSLLKVKVFLDYYLHF